MIAFSALAILGGPAVRHAALAQDLAVPDDILTLIEDVVGLPSEVSPQGLRFELNSSNGSYREGDFVEFGLTAPDYEGYLYLDYYQIDGNVVHILPGPVEPVAVPRGVELMVGTPEWGVTYEILPPFGRELLVLMAAPQRLFDEPRREFEYAPLYLEDLRAGLEPLRQSGQGELAVLYRAIQTHPRDAVIAQAPATPDRPKPAAEPPEEPSPPLQPAPQAPVADQDAGGTAGAPAHTVGGAALPAAPVADVSPETPQSDPPQSDPPQSDPPQSDPPQSDPTQSDPTQSDPPQSVSVPSPVPDPAIVPTLQPAPQPPAAQTAALPAAPPEPLDPEAALRQRIGTLNDRMRVDPNDMAVVRELAASYRDHAQLMFDRGDFDKARFSVSMVTALDVTNAELVSFAENLKIKIAIRESIDEGLTQLSGGRADLAYESFRNVLVLDPENAEAERRIAEIAPDVAEYYHKEALAAARRQNLDQAVEIWDKVLTIYPEFEAARLKRSEALRRKKMLEQIPRAN